MKENINENINNLSQVLLPKDINEQQNTVGGIVDELANTGEAVAGIATTEGVGEIIAGFFEVIGEIFSGL